MLAKTASAVAAIGTAAFLTPASRSYGAPYAYGYSDDGCYWSRRRALYTNSPYWRNRCYACLDGDGNY